MTRKAKQTIPAYGCLVAINTITASIDKTIPVTILCLSQTGLLSIEAGYDHTADSVQNRDADDHNIYDLHP